MQLLEVWNRRTLEQELSCPESQQFYQQMIETWRGKVGKVKRSLFGDGKVGKVKRSLFGETGSECGRAIMAVLIIRFRTN